jgi:hypothetical protein
VPLNVRVSGEEPLAVRASRRRITEEGLITKYSGVRLRMDLDRIRSGQRTVVPVAATIGSQLLMSTVGSSSLPSSIAVTQTYSPPSKLTTEPTD